MKLCRHRGKTLWRHIRSNKVYYGWGSSVTFFLILASCATVDRTVFTPPHISGAEFVGTEDCTLCHDQIGENFKNSIHANVSLYHEEMDISCEACHGAGSFHSEEGGGRHLIHNPGSSPDTCLTCHTSVQMEFTLPHHHPIDNEMVSCIDCHDVHGNNSWELGSHLKNESTCQSCHAEQTQPHVFEHEAMREGCQTCHSPHGSMHEKMLKIPNANLCLQCHATDQSNDRLMIGEVDHSGFGFIQSGSCWTAGCHEAVHGSSVNGSLRF